MLGIGRLEIGRRGVDRGVSLGRRAREQGAVVAPERHRAALARQRAQIVGVEVLEIIDVDGAEHDADERSVRGVEALADIDHRLAVRPFERRADIDFELGMVAQPAEILAVRDVALRRDRVAARAIDDIAVGGCDRQRVELRDAGHLRAQQAERSLIARGLAQPGSRGDALGLKIGGDVVEHDAERFRRCARSAPRSGGRAPRRRRGRLRAERRAGATASWQ